MKILVGLIIIVFGIASFIKPVEIWKWFEGGWKLKNVEPSEEYIFSKQIIGIILIVLGVLIEVWGIPFRFKIKFNYGC